MAVCIKVLLIKGKAFEKNTKLNVINKRLSVEMNKRKQDQNHHKATNATGKVLPFRQVTYSSSTCIKSEK